MVGPSEAVRLLVSLAAGSAVVEDGEDDVDAADLTAALTLMPRVRAEVPGAVLLLVGDGPYAPALNRSVLIGDPHLGSVSHGSVKL